MSSSISLPALLSRYPLSTFLSSLSLTILIYVIYTRYSTPLRKVPGPWLASISQLDRLLTAASGKQMLTHIRYHERYGPVVRVGPNHVSFADGVLIPKVYGIAGKFRKSDFYTVFGGNNPSTGERIETVFTVRDEIHHRNMRRPIANAFSMSSMVEMEPMTNECISILQKKMNKYEGQSVDLGQWLHWYAFDVITSITFSNRMGFLEREIDVSEVIESIEGRLMYNSTIGQTPWLNQFLLGNDAVFGLLSWWPAIKKMGSNRFIFRFAAKQLERYQNVEKESEDVKDMLARFKRLSADGAVMSDSQLLGHAASNIFAGADTTAISLRAMIYYLCKTPRVYAKLVEEIDKTELSDPVTFGEASRMAYLQACMKEAMRLHPAVGQLLERYAPPEGIEISGVWLPGGTIIGANPWVMGRDKTVYGEDSDQFRPERWLEADAAALKLMERNYLAFGAGSRSCLGKNISLLEMSKLIPQLLREYEIELTEPQKEWELAGYWFVKQTGLFCTMKQRKGRRMDDKI